MSNLPPFEFQANYDSTSIQAATHTLFIRHWRAKLLGTLGVVASVVFGIALCWYYRAWAGIWVMTFFAATNVLVWPYIRWAIRHLLRRNLGASAQVQFTLSDFSITSAAGSHTLPWSHFLFSQTDDQNLHLFVSKTKAITIPTSSAPAGAIQFAQAQIRAAQSPSNQRLERP